MKIKRFVAKNMREAIRQVREEQGPDAVILSNRRVTGGIEVVAAVDYDAALMQQSLRRQAAVAAEAVTAMPVESPPPAPIVAQEALAREDEALAILFDDFADLPKRPGSANAKLGNAERPIVIPDVGQELAAAIDPVPAAAMPELTVEASIAAAPAPAESTIPLSPAMVPVSEFQVLKEELGSLRRTLETQLSGLAWNNLRQNQPRRYAVLRVLFDLGILPVVARAIADELPESTGVERARFLPLGFLSRRIPVAPVDALLAGGIYALVGPTGVGKTTTIAKLAARYAEAHGTRDIALVAMDHYRIGAQEQLYTYGRLLGVTVHTVTPQQPLAATLDRLADRKLVLIDTVGMSPRDAALDTQITQLAAAHPQLQAFLMLAANAQADDQLEVARRFGAARLAGCIISKVDETARLGGALSVAIQHRLPIAYFTDGQRVPEDLHVARADHLVIRAMQVARQCPAPPDDETLALMHEASLMAAAPATSPVVGGASHV
jgi:flagellar biosynthesis protein FlhF